MSDRSIPISTGNRHQGGSGERAWCYTRNVADLCYWTRTPLYRGRQAGSRWPSYQDHERIELTLIVGSRRHRVGIRTTPRDRYIWIGPDLDHGTPKLAQGLKAEGYSRHQRVVLALEGSTLRLSPQ